MIPCRIILHHSFTKDSKTVSWDAIRRFHTQHYGWSDIGYHYGIELVGNHYEVLTGRMLNRQGAHTRGFNVNTIGICFIGNFDSKPLPIAQWSLGVRLVSSLCEVLYIGVDQIFLHNEFSKKTCAGLLFDKSLFVKHVSDMLKGQAPPRSIS